MSHRIRYAMKAGPLTLKLRGKVEVDEAYVGGKQVNRPNAVRRDGVVPRKTQAIALVQRTGKVRAFPVRQRLSGQAEGRDPRERPQGLHVYTDSANLYEGIGLSF